MGKRLTTLVLIFSAPKRGTISKPQLIATNITREIQQSEINGPEWVTDESI